MAARDVLIPSCPLQDGVAVCKLPGSAILLSLEHGLGAVRAREPGEETAEREPGDGALLADGPFPHAFPQLFGLRVCYDPKRRRGDRVLRAELASTGAELRPDELYGLATVRFVLRGGDGFEPLRAACEGNATVTAGGPLDSEAITELFRSSSPLGAPDLPPAIERLEASDAAEPAGIRGAWAWLRGTRKPGGVCARARAAAEAAGGRGGQRGEPFPPPVRLGLAEALAAVRGADEPPESVVRAAEAVPGGAHPCSFAPAEGVVAWEVCPGRSSSERDTSLRTMPGG